MVIMDMLDRNIARFFTGYKRQTRLGSRLLVYVRHEREDYFGCRQFFWVYFGKKYLVVPKLPFFIPVVWDLQLCFQQDQARAILSLLATVMANIWCTLRLGFGNPCLSR